MSERLRHMLARFRRDEGGAVIVEFALTLPLMLVLFAFIVESGRTFWAYQSAVAGVRDATRYVGRADERTCDDGDVVGTPQVSDAALLEIVNRGLRGGVIAQPITINTVTGDYECSEENGFVIATVAAQATLQLPFTGIFRLVVEDSDLGEIAVALSDSTRMFGQ